MWVKRYSLLAMSLMTFGLLSGCATGRNYQTDIDSLNNRVSGLQSQIASKDDEIVKLRSRLSSQEAALAQSDSEKRNLSDRLDSALSKLETKTRQIETKPIQKIDSDLK